MTGSKDAEFSLDHPVGLRIHSYLREAAARSIPDAVMRDMGTGYVWYDLPVRTIAADLVRISVCFFAGVVDSLSVAIASGESVSTGRIWSEQAELEVATATERWFRTIGFPIGRYAWGTVYAGYDPRSGSGGGGVRFARASSSTGEAAQPSAAAAEAPRRTGEN
jgi:hypothetical protein